MVLCSYEDKTEGEAKGRMETWRGKTRVVEHMFTCSVLGVSPTHPHTDETVSSHSRGSSQALSGHRSRFLNVTSEGSIQGLH